MNLYDDWDQYWNGKKIGLSSKKGINNLTNSSISNTYTKATNVMNSNTSTTNKPLGY